MGAFKKTGDLSFSIETFRNILLKKESMYMPIFNNMTPLEIHNYTKIDHGKDEETERLDHLVPLYKLAFFGVQFTDIQSEYLLLFKEQIFQFIWKMTSKDDCITLKSGLMSLVI